MTNKRSYPTFEVIIWGEDDQPLRTIIVRPVPFRGKKGGLADVIALQEKLLKDFVEHDGRLASLLINPSTWKAMTQLAGLLPVVGESTVGFDIEPLANANDVTQLGRIFLAVVFSAPQNICTKRTPRSTNLRASKHWRPKGPTSSSSSW